ncbi:NAD(P)-binding protein [Bradyrhizobium sp. 164]|uniref:NAD(P)-binding protein n=1 Tax=Bradyrhizobium sp. 164 TaxID=2782637 RepID=UPI001FFA386F|nr:NAD(P)-binding protein [Bradyrhizobium sp. 164]MCK1594992.1 NAD(P)-binding protein [Bradyrhizobium sp. 164]
MPHGSQINVVIIGGGPAGLAAAFWLTAPEQNDRYRVTLYTQGWRLGGKCASGRNYSEHDRIEEHGLHMLMGCYHNAFATLRACYEAWHPGPGSPLSTWEQAFIPQRKITLMEPDGRGGAWEPWDFANLPRSPGEPGDGLGADPMAARALAEGPVDAMHRLVKRLADWLETSVGLDKLINCGKAAIAALRAPLFEPTDERTKKKLNDLEIANKQLREAIGNKGWQPAGHDAEQNESFQLASGAMSRLLILANLGVATGLGYLRDIAHSGEAAYDKLNAQDFRAWLATCGAFDETLASAPIRALYDLAFAFRDGLAGNIDNGSMAAGVTFRFAMELTFGYRNAPLWKMAAGTGDTIFTPFYEVLEARQPGCVQFFSRLTDMTAANGRIQSIEISIQAVTGDGTPYRPLVPVKNLQCWPNQPDWDQLKDGSVLRGCNFESSFCTASAGTRPLQVDQDFDLVILAIPPAAITKTPASFAQGSARWQAALGDSRSVGTQSLQLWMGPPIAGLGWPLGPTVLTAFAENYDSWGDMSHQLQTESWSCPDAPQTIGYFVGCLHVPQQPAPTPDSMQQAANQQADQWIAQHLPILWPGYGAGQQTCRCVAANFDGSDLYVQTPSGTNVASRFSSADTADFANLYVVGDWTRTRFSGGCFESAIESAMLASRAISNFPTHIKTT